MPPARTLAATVKCMGKEAPWGIHYPPHHPYRGSWVTSPPTACKAKSASTSSAISQSCISWAKASKTPRGPVWPVWPVIPKNKKPDQQLLQSAKFTWNLKIIVIEKEKNSSKPLYFSGSMLIFQAVHLALQGTPSQALERATPRSQSTQRFRRPLRWPLMTLGEVDSGVFPCWPLKIARNTKCCFKEFEIPHCACDRVSCGSDSMGWSRAFSEWLWDINTCYIQIHLTMTVMHWIQMTKGVSKCDNKLGLEETWRNHL